MPEILICRASNFRNGGASGSGGSLRGSRSILARGGGRGVVRNTAFPTPYDRVPNGRSSGSRGRRETFTAGQRSVFALIDPRYVVFLR
jgi:hypothetical protein